MSLSVPVSAGPLRLPFHGDRERLFNELHTRPFPVLAQGSRISQLALLHDGQSGEAEYRHLHRLCERYAVLPPLPGASCHIQHFGSFELRWERHSEFSTYTFIHVDTAAAPFSRTALSLLPAEWLEALPGKVISGVHVELHDLPGAAPTADDVRPHFENQRLISSWVLDRHARLWTAFRLHQDGLGRILVQSRDLNVCQLGRLVRRLLEIETYRMMVLLTFPVARALAPELGGMDRRMAAINAEINAIHGLDDERRLLDDLSTLAARIEHLRSETNARFAAARAYHELVLDRLDGLREQGEFGLQTFEEFLLRRLTPAFRTGEAVSDQLDSLATRIDRASKLLRTRVDLTLEAQNQDLLQSMNRRGHLQLQLQQAVEGLSVVAITYYLVGLVKHVAGSLAEVGWISHPEWVAGLSVPLCLFLVWRGVRRLRKGLEKHG